MKQTKATLEIFFIGSMDPSVHEFGLFRQGPIFGCPKPKLGTKILFYSLWPLDQAGLSFWHSE